MILHPRTLLASSVFMLVLTAGTALAHHSFAVYDHTQTLKLKGTVTKFQWSNPHAYLDMDVKEAYKALQILVAKHRIQLYEPGGGLVDRSVFLDNLE